MAHFRCPDARASSAAFAPAGIPHDHCWAVNTLNTPLLAVCPARVSRQCDHGTKQRATHDPSFHTIVLTSNLLLPGVSQCSACAGACPQRGAASYLVTHDTASSSSSSSGACWQCKPPIFGSCCWHCDWQRSGRGYSGSPGGVCFAQTEGKISTKSSLRSWLINAHLACRTTPIICSFWSTAMS